MCTRTPFCRSRWNLGHTVAVTFDSGSRELHLTRHEKVGFASKIEWKRNKKYGPALVLRVKDKASLRVMGAQRFESIHPNTL